MNDARGVGLFEAARHLGGRARALEVALPEGGMLRLDNGQHILIGAYVQTLRLMRQVGVRTGDALLATLRMKHGQRVHVLTAHLKSKRPKFLQDAQGQPLEDPDDPRVAAVASVRSLLMRAAEATALRLKVVELLHHTQTPLVLMGDLNDGPHSVTTQLIAATTSAAYDKGARDTALYNAWDVQVGAALRRDVAYSHIHLGFPEVLDQVLVSEEFVAGGRGAIGDVRRVEVFNDHLFEGRDRGELDIAVDDQGVRGFQQLEPGERGE